MELTKTIYTYLKVELIIVLRINFSVIQLTSSNLRPVSEKILSLKTDLSSLITLATIVFSMPKITSGLKDFFKKVTPGAPLIPFVVRNIVN